ncbi:MAG: phosphoribosyltransferase family protein [Specibacter sp.]
MGVSSEARPWFPFDDRDDAGLRLARKMVSLRRSPDTVVLALARGGVPVGQAVASALALPWDVMVVRKLGVPGSPETAFGALARYGALTAAVHLPATMEYLRRNGYDPAELEQVDAAERAELARRQALYVTEPQPAVAGRTILLCDDGAATGATLQAAVGLLREQRAGTIHVCVPAAPARTCSELAELADKMTCLQPWPTMHSVSEAYLRFDQLDDARVMAALAGRATPGT